MSRRQRFLSAIAHPQIAYLLLTLGILGLTVELWNPGAIAAWRRGRCLPAARVLRAAGAAGEHDRHAADRVRSGAALLELKVPSFGVLGIGGTVESRPRIGDDDQRRCPASAFALRFIVPVALAFAGILLFLGRLALQAQRQRPVTGADALIGLQGRARTPITPGVTGQIDVRGEIWRARERGAARCRGCRCESWRSTG